MSYYNTFLNVLNEYTYCQNRMSVGNYPIDLPLMGPVPGEVNKIDLTISRQS